MSASAAHLALDSDPADVRETAPIRFCGYHHARVHEADLVYHVVSRTYQGRWLLTPCPAFNDITAGVLGRAQALFPSVKLFAYAFLTNHFHLMVQGSPGEIPVFVGYLKRELSRRWGAAARWPNGLWADAYQSTALPTLDSQVSCFEYILSQGVKEGAVAAPEEWPGIHVAHQLIDREILEGTWLDGSSFAKAAFRARKRTGATTIKKQLFAIDYVVRVDRLPAWAHMSDEDVMRELGLMRTRIMRAHRKSQHLRPTRQLTRKRFDHRSAPVPPPWWQTRRRLICWASENAPETRAYLARYWSLQRTFRAASNAWRDGAVAIPFPQRCFRPGRFEELIASM